MALAWGYAMARHLLALVFFAIVNHHLRPLLDDSTNSFFFPFLSCLLSINLQMSD